MRSLPNPFLRERDATVVFLALAVLLNFFALRTYLADQKRRALDAVADAAPTVAYQLDPISAPVDEIALLPGVGIARATEFVRARKLGFRPAYAPDFRSVPGFGPATIERIAPFLNLSSGLDPPK